MLKYLNRLSSQICNNPTKLGTLTTRVSYRIPAVDLDDIFKYHSIIPGQNYPLLKTTRKKPTIIFYSF